MNLREIKAAVRRLSVEERGRLQIWLLHEMPKDEAPDEPEEEGLHVDRKALEGGLHVPRPPAPKKGKRR